MSTAPKIIDMEELELGESMTAKATWTKSGLRGVEFSDGKSTVFLKAALLDQLASWLETLWSEDDDGDIVVTDEDDEDEGPEIVYGLEARHLA